MLEFIENILFKAALAIISALIAGFIIPLFWNNVIPQLTGWSEMTYWQGYWFYLLILILIPSKHVRWNSDDNS